MPSSLDLGQPLRHSEPPRGALRPPASPRVPKLPLCCFSACLHLGLCHQHRGHRPAETADHDPAKAPTPTPTSPLTPTAPAQWRRSPARFPFSSSCQEKRKTLIWWLGQDGHHRGTRRGQDGEVGLDSPSQDSSAAPHKAPRGPARPSVPLPSAAPGCVARVKLTPDTGSRRAVSAARWQPRAGSGPGAPSCWGRGRFWGRECEFAVPAWAVGLVLL